MSLIYVISLLYVRTEECSHVIKVISIGHHCLVIFYTYLTSLMVEVLPMCLTAAMARGLEVRQK